MQLREKETEGRKQRAGRYDIRQKFWEGVVQHAREKGGRHANIKPGSHGWIAAGAGTRGLSWNLAVKQESSKAELYIDRGDYEANKSVFDQLMKDRQAIEAASPFPLEWQRLDERRACRIKSVVEGGYRSPESDWPNIQVALVDRMTALEKALRPFLDKLQL